MNKIGREPYRSRDVTDDRRVMLNIWNLHDVEGLNFFYGDQDDLKLVSVIDGAQKEATFSSCREAGLDAVLVPTFNLKSLLAADLAKELKHIVLTGSHGSQPWINHIKLMNHNLSYDEVSRVLDHMMVWNQVSTDGLPRLVLESGTVLYKKIQGTMPKNTILSLDNQFQVYEHNENYLCMMGVHAYAVDQYSARALFNSVISGGIIEPLERMFRLDKYCCLPLNAAKKV